MEEKDYSWWMLVWWRFDRDVFIEAEIANELSAEEIRRRIREHYDGFIEEEEEDEQE